MLIEASQYLRTDQLGDLLEGVGLIEVASQYLLQGPAWPQWITRRRGRAFIVEPGLDRLRSQSLSHQAEDSLRHHHLRLVHDQPVARCVVAEAIRRLRTPENLALARLSLLSASGTLCDLGPLVFGELRLDAPHQRSFGAVVTIVVERFSLTSVFRLREGGRMSIESGWRALCLETYSKASACFP